MSQITLASAEGQLPDHEDISPYPLAVRGMTVSYGQKPVVFSVDATIPEGSMTAIIGPNGAGKSTLLKAVLGILRPLSGRVTVLENRLMRSVTALPMSRSVPVSTGIFRQPFSMSC